MIHFIKAAAVKAVAAAVIMVVLISSFASVTFAAGYCGVVTAGVLNIRTAPNTECEIAGQYTNGTVVDIVGIEGAWYKINYNGADAYLSSEYVNLIDPSEASRYAAERTKGQRILDIASAYLGTPYVYGGMSPSGFDCSGFVKYCFGQMGITLGRTAASQTAHGTYVSKEELIPGDLVFFITDGYSISHVGIYAGNGMMIHSPRPGKRVEYITINSGYYAERYTTARRIF